MHPIPDHDSPEGVFSGRIGRYEILRKIATGGMADLFLAKQVGMDGFEKVVAIKRILTHLAHDEEFIGMFRDEARIVAKLNHPNVVQIYDFGKSGDSYFIAMEYIPGRNLSSIAKKARAQGSPLPPVYVARCLAQACEGLAYAHTRRDLDGQELAIIHRDVSPQNIIVAFSGSVKLVDFGIAKAASKVAHTRAGVLKGKYAYMSPEQIRGEPIDARSDLFSVGVVLYELLCGRRPFEKDNSIQTLKAIVQDPPVPPGELAPSLPEELARVIERCLEKNKAARFQSAQEIQLALEDFVDGSGQRCNSITISHWLTQLFGDELRRENGGTVVFQGVGEVVLPEVASPPAALAPPPSLSAATDAPRAELIEETPIRSRPAPRAETDSQTVFADREPEPRFDSEEAARAASAVTRHLEKALEDPGYHGPEPADDEDDDFGDATVAMAPISPDEAETGAMAGRGWTEALAQGVAPSLEALPELDGDGSPFYDEDEAAIELDPFDDLSDNFPVVGIDPTLAMVGEPADATFAMDGEGDQTLGAEEFEALMAEAEARRRENEAEAGGFAAREGTLGDEDDIATDHADATIAQDGEDGFEPDGTIAIDEEPGDMTLAGRFEPGSDDDDEEGPLDGLDKLSTVRAMDEEPSLPVPAVLSNGRDRDERTTAGVSEDYWEAGLEVPEGGAFDPLPEPDLDFLRQVEAPVPAPLARGATPLGAIALGKRVVPVEVPEAGTGSPPDPLDELGPLDDLALGVDEPEGRVVPAPLHGSAPPPFETPHPAAAPDSAASVHPAGAAHPAEPPPSRSAKDEYASLVAPARPERSHPALGSTNVPAIHESLGEVLAQPIRPGSVVTSAAAGTRLRAIPRGAGGPDGRGGTFSGVPVPNEAPARASTVTAAPSVLARAPRAAPRRPAPWQAALRVVGVLAAAVLLALGTYAVLHWLYPSGPTLTVESDPVGARVWVDGTLQPQATPTTIGGLDHERVHQVQVGLDGYQTVVRQVDLSDGRPVIMEISLPPLSR